MRNRLLLLTAAVILSACADDQHSTAPASSRSARSNAAGDVGASGQSAVNPSAKPTDQVGLTTVFTVVGNSVSISLGDGPKLATATCPTGSQAVSGGYAVSSYPGSRYLNVVQVGVNAANGWTVTGWVQDLAAPTIEVIPTVTCIK